ncbi:MAG: 2-oxoacid:acceptor oxidoreductase family protein [Deltaproteobacteria bacterium]|nr:2-oxoacid:acceptor oxidoreductase family protein [Deltaproteobacteria bacterium]
MSVFYDRFVRHDRGEGLKAHATHYCAGCGHGVVHRELAEAIEHLGIQDRTVLVSPVGCSVFAYYYFDVGNTQAAHGRAPAVALGHKLANPEAVVISYQGDGDLASIGLAETISIAQLGLPLTVIFINNAVYGMTGGQLAPTSLIGQKTVTSPEGRSSLMGQPLRMAELIAGLDGPVYVERVALFAPQQRTRARKAIEKALRLQKEGRGYSFVEVLAECPTHLKLTPEQSEAWVRDEMTKIFPLGLLKDTSDTPAVPWSRPERSFDGEAILTMLGVERAHEHPEARRASAFPRHLGGDDLAFKLAGAGGDGAQTAALLLARAALAEGFDATHIPSYGPESRGGTSFADVHIAEREVLDPAAPDPHVLVAFNRPSLVRFAPQVRDGGTILYDSTVVTDPGPLPAGRRVVPVPFTGLASALAHPLVKNIVALGALYGALAPLPEARFRDTLREVLAAKASLLPLNEAAFDEGRRYVLVAGAP